MSIALGNGAKDARGFGGERWGNGFSSPTC